MDILTRQRYSIREYQRSECEMLAALGERMYNKSELARAYYDRRKTEASLRSFANSERYFRRVFVDSADEPVGLFVACIDSPYFSSDVIASDRVFFIDERHRGHCGLQLTQLVEQYTRWAKSHGAKIVTIGTSTGIDTDKTSLVLERLGFAKIGALHKWSGG